MSRRRKLAGHGYRRMLVSREGLPKHILQFGERKGVLEDRVILVPASAEEVTCIQNIFEMYTRKGMLPCQIANELNRLGYRYSGIKRNRWYSLAVSRTLSNPKYAGINVYGRYTQKLYTRKVRTPTESWTIQKNCWEPLVSNEVFEQAEDRRRNQTFFKSDEQILGDLRNVLETYGTLSERLLHQLGLPTSGTYRRRFGSVTEAFMRVGFSTPRVKIVESRRRHRAVMDQLLETISNADPAIVIHNSRRSARPRIYFPDGTVMTVYMCPSTVNNSGELRWKIAVYENGGIPLLLLTRLKQDNQSIFDTYVMDGLPPIGQSWSAEMSDPWLETGIRIESLTELQAAKAALVRRRLSASS